MAPRARERARPSPARRRTPRPRIRARAAGGSSYPCRSRCPAGASLSARAPARRTPGWRARHRARRARCSGRRKAPEPHRRRARGRGQQQPSCPVDPLNGQDRFSNDATRVEAAQQRAQRGVGIDPRETSWDWGHLRTECEREALKLTRNRHDAEEIAQEAMTRAWCKRHTCRTPDSPRAWVRQIARNEALRAMRRRPGETLVDDVALLAEDVAAPAESM